MPEKLDETEEGNKKRTENLVRALRIELGYDLWKEQGREKGERANKKQI
jgi:hypothetical protein